MPQKSLPQPTHPGLDGKWYSTELDAGIHRETRIQPEVFHQALAQFRYAVASGSLESKKR